MRCNHRRVFKKGALYEKNNMDQKNYITKMRKRKGNH